MAKSVTQMLAGLKAGDEEASEKLVHRFLDRLVAFGKAVYRRRFHDTPRVPEDEEDAAISALQSFLRRAQRQEFQQLSNRQDLWRLLARITIRKIFDQRERALTAKRGGKVQRLRLDDAEHLLVEMPGPEIAAETMDTYRAAMDKLDRADLKRIAQMALDGWARAEIAKELGISDRTVYRKLQLIWEAWNGYQAKIEDGPLLCHDTR